MDLLSYLGTPPVKSEGLMKSRKQVSDKKNPYSKQMSKYDTEPRRDTTFMEVNCQDCGN